MVSRTAGNYVYSRYIVKLLSCKADSVKFNTAVFVKPSVHGLSNSLRLLVNLLEHKMLIAFLLCSVGIPCHMKHIALDFVSVFVIYFNRIFVKNHCLSVFDKINLSYIFEKCRNIRCNKITSLAYSRNQRGVFSDRNYFARIL